MKLTLHEYSLPLRHAFRIARSSVSVQHTLIVELSEDGLSGFGEATANSYYNVTVASSRAALETVREALGQLTLSTPEALWNMLRAQLGATPFAQCALDEAAHDLWGKKLGKPVYALWGEPMPTGPLSDYTLGIAPIPEMIAKLQEVPNWPIYKIKLGTPHDLEIVRSLRRHTAAVFRVDANCAWSAEQTARLSAALRELDVEFIEQPMPREPWAAMRTLQSESALPLVADESCQSEEDVPRCAGLFAGINIKLVKCGGLTPARRMLREARRLGLKTMLGCMTESTVGISSAAQLLPYADWADLDGAVLLQKDTAQGVRLECGRLIFPSTPGTGVTLL